MRKKKQGFAWQTAQKAAVYLRLLLYTGDGNSRKGFYVVRTLKSGCFYYLRFYDVNPARMAGLELFIIWHSILCFQRRKLKRPGRFSQFVF